MFQTQIKIYEQDNLPPFLKTRNGFREANLLQSTSYCRDGRQRLATPDKIAIMELSNSHHKRRLGKQQKILSDITKRCREQDVTDLSSALSQKCTLRGQGKSENPKENSTAGLILTKRPSSDPSQNNQSEYCYKSFPVRKIIKRMRTDFYQHPLFRSRTTLTKETSIVGGPSNPKLMSRSNSPRKGPSAWDAQSTHSKPSEQMIFATSRIDPEPRSKPMEKNASLSNRSQKSTKEAEQEPVSIENCFDGREQ